MNARERAVEVGREAVESALFGVMILRGRGERVSDQAESVIVATGVLDALLSESVSDCETCSGTGKLPTETVSAFVQFGTTRPCPDCIDGKVSGPALAVLCTDMEQVDGWFIYPEGAANDGMGEEHPALVHEWGDGCEYEPACEPIYRLKESP